MVYCLNENSDLTINNGIQIYIDTDVLSSNLADIGKKHYICN